VTLGHIDIFSTKLTMSFRVAPHEGHLD